MSEAAHTDRDAAADLPDSTILSVRGLRKFFDVGDGDVVRAVDDVSFDVQRCETLSLVGESGCGKTTAARAIIRAYEPTSGEL